MRKRYILYIVVILLSIINIINTNNTSALSYSSSVGVGFTFNPTLSVNISSNLIINNLVPGSNSDSNIINVSVATNASYGYALSAIVNGNNSDLVHTNNSNNSNNVFSSIDINADLSDLDNSEDTNIWGYSYKDNTVVSPTWSNYNGLSSSNSTVLLDTNSNNSNVEANGIDSIDFKIAAKAASTQSSGEYTGTINFIAVSKVAPMSLLDSFIASGAEQLNGYFKMQDMTHDICSNVDIEESELQLIDVRDNKVYWVAKLKDGNCWMTQNLDLDLDNNRTYTHWDTDLGWDNPNNLDTNATWRPIHSTIDFTIGSTIAGWQDSNAEPYSANPGHLYFYTSNSDANDIQYNSLQECKNAGHNDCVHYHVGNYYNYAATTSNNEASNLTNAPNSICPSGWRLPKHYDIYRDYYYLVNDYNLNDDNALNLRNPPLYFARSGFIYQNLSRLNNAGYYWSNSGSNSLYFVKGWLSTGLSVHKYYGFSVRCLAR